MTSTTTWPDNRGTEPAEEPVSGANRALSKLVSQSSHYVLGMAITLVLGLISFPVFTRVFSVADYGTIDFVQKIILLVTTVAKAAMQNSVIRFYDRIACARDAEAHRGYYSTMFFGVAALAGVVTLIFVLSMRVFSGPLPTILLFSSALISLRALQSILWAFLRIEDRTKTYNVISVLMKGATIVAILLMLPWAGVSVRTYFLAMMTVEAIVVACVALPLTVRGLLAFRSFQPKLFWTAIVFGVPLILQELFGIVLDSGDRALVQHYLGADALGFYSVAYGLSGYVNNFMIAPLGLAITPIYMALWNDEGPERTADFLSRGLDLFLMASFAVMAVVWACSHHILVLLASQKYQGADRLMPPIVGGLLIYTTQVFVNAGLIIHKRTGLLAGIVGLSAVVNVALNCLLLPVMGLHAAALATFWSYAFYSVLIGIVAGRFLPLKFELLNAGRYVLSAVMAVWTAAHVHAQIPAMNALLKTGTAVVTYVAILLILDSRLRVWTGEAWRWFRRPHAEPASFAAPSAPVREHILFVFDQLSHLDGGAERALLRLVRMLPRDRFRVSVATFCAPRDRAFLEVLGCPVHCFEVSKCISLQGAKVALELSRLIRRERVSLVQTFFPSSDLWGSVIARLSGCSTIISSRRDMGFQLTAKHKIAYRLLSPNFVRVHAVSEAVRQFTIHQDRVDPRKVVTIPNGVRVPTIMEPAERNLVRARYGVDPAAPLIVDVGNIGPVKGFEVLVQTAAIVCRSNPKTVFLVVGHRKNEKYVEGLMDLARSLGVESNVRFAGFEPDPLPLLQASDIFCHLSLTDGLSNALLEAMSASVPCVISAVGGNPEVVQDEWNGFIVPPGDPEAAADRVCRLLSQPSMARAMGREGRRFVEERFSERHMAESFISMYEELLRQKAVR